MYDPLLTLATAAAVTERIGIGGQVTRGVLRPAVAGERAGQPRLPQRRPPDRRRRRRLVARRVRGAREQLRGSWQPHRRDHRHPPRRLARPAGEFRRPALHVRPGADPPATRTSGPDLDRGRDRARPTGARAVAMGDGFHAGSWVLPPDAMADAVARVRAVRPEPEFVFSVYTHDWDPAKVAPDVIRAEYDAYETAGRAVRGGGAGPAGDRRVAGLGGGAGAGRRRRAPPLKHRETVTPVAIELDFDGRVVLVTGGTKGVGRGSRNASPTPGRRSRSAPATSPRPCPTGGRGSAPTSATATPRGRWSTRSSTGSAASTCW